MIVIYEAANGVEAHMILHLLQQYHIEGQVDGEYLQGAMGELPATGNVRVSVMPEDVEEAKKIIAGWESMQPAEAPKMQPETRGQKASYFAAGAVVATAVLFLLFRFPGTNEGFDYNGDGKLDEIYSMQGNLLSKIEIDRNRDGDIDLRWLYGFDGVLEKMQADNDFNGKFERTTIYIEGNPDVERIDSSGDGPRDIRNNYQNGVLVSSELFDPFTNRKKKINRYDPYGKLIESELDTNGTGAYDVKTIYDEFEEPIR